MAVIGFQAIYTPLSQLHPAALPNCALLASTESIALITPSGHIATYNFDIPAGITFAGMNLFHQILQLDFSSQGTPSSLSSSSCLALTTGIL